MTRGKLKLILSEYHKLLHLDINLNKWQDYLKSFVDKYELIYYNGNISYTYHGEWFDLDVVYREKQRCLKNL